MKQSITAITVVALSLAVAGANASDKKPLKFEITKMADGIDEAATEAGFHTKPWANCHLAFTLYTASTGGGVSVRSAYFATAEEADRYFQWSLDQAAKVGWEEQNANANGTQAVRRAVLSKGNEWQLMLTGGGTFRSFTASDRQILLEFGKQFIEPKFGIDGVSPN